MTPVRASVFAGALDCMVSLVGSGDRVTQRAEAVDLDFDDVTGLQEQPAGRATCPTPAGVPVAMMSPGSRVMICERNAIVSATPKIIDAGRAVLHGLAVDARAERERLEVVDLVERARAAGPQGPNVSIALPPVQRLLAICRSRALTSLKAIAPAT